MILSQKLNLWNSLIHIHVLRIVFLSKKSMSLFVIWTQVEPSDSVRRYYKIQPWHILFLLCAHRSKFWFSSSVYCSMFILLATNFFCSLKRKRGCCMLVNFFLFAMFYFILFQFFFFCPIISDSNLGIDFGKEASRGSSQLSQSSYRHTGILQVKHTLPCNTIR